MMQANDDSGAPIHIPGQSAEDVPMVHGLDWEPWAWICARRSLFGRIAVRPWATEIQIEPVHEMPWDMLPKNQVASIQPGDTLILVWIAFRSVIPQGQRVAVALSDAVLIAQDAAGLMAKVDSFLKQTGANVQKMATGAGQIVVPQMKTPPTRRVRFNGEEI